MSMTDAPALWRKSSYSGGEANCVEVGQGGPEIAVRDTRDRQGPALAFSREGWREFTRRVKAGAETILARYWQRRPGKLCCPAHGTGAPRHRSGGALLVLPSRRIRCV